MFKRIQCFCMFVNKHFANFKGKQFENSLDQEFEIFRVLY